MSLGALSIVIKGDISQFNRDIAAVQKQLNASTKGLQTVSKSMTSVGDSMTKGVTVPLIAVGAILLKVGKDFDDAYDKIRIGTGKTGDALTGLQDDFKAVAKDSASSFGDISTTIAELNKRLGLTGKPLQDLSTQMLNFARITGGDINTLIPATTRIFGDWSIATDKQSETLDYLFRVQQNTGISVDALAQKVVQFGAPLRQMGFDFETSAALIGKWEKEGVNAELVLGSLRIALAKFASAGVKDTNAALLELIDKVKSAGSTGEATGIAIEAFGRKAGPDMAAAIREGRFDLDTLLEQLKNGTDTINGAADATDDWMEKLTKLKNNAMVQLEPVANKVFDSITAAVDRVSPKIEDLAKWFGKLTESQVDNLLKWGLIVAAIGPVLSIMGRTITGVIKLRAAILTLNAAIIANPYIAAAAAVVAINVAADMGAKKLGELDSVWAKIGETWLRVIAPLTLVKKGLTDDLTIIEAMKDGTISYTDILDVNIFKLGELAQKIKELRAEKEADLNATVHLANNTKNYTDLIGESTKSTDQYKVSLNSMGKATGEVALTEEELTKQQDELNKKLEEAKKVIDALCASLFKEYLNSEAINELLAKSNEDYAIYLKNLNSEGSVRHENTAAMQAYLSTNSEYLEQTAKANEIQAKLNKMVEAGTTGSSSYQAAQQQLAGVQDKINKITNEAAAATSSYTSTGKQTQKQIEATAAALHTWIADDLEPLVSTWLPQLLEKTGSWTAAEYAQALSIKENIDKAHQLGVEVPAVYDSITAKIVDAIYNQWNPALSAGINRLNDLDKQAGLTGSGIWAALSTAADPIYSSFNPALSAGINRLIELDETKCQPVISVDTSGAIRGINDVAARLRDLNGQSSSTFIYEYKIKKWASGGLVGFKDGGMISASQGINLPKFDNGGVLAMLHPPEVVLNGKQALQLVWNMAHPVESKQTTSSKQEILLKNVINLDGKVLWESNEKYAIRAQGERV